MQSNQESPADAAGVGQPKREASLAAPNGYAAGESPEVLSDYSLAMAVWADARAEKKEKACRDAMRAADDKYYALRDAIVKRHTEKGQR